MVLSFLPSSIHPPKNPCTVFKSVMVVIWSTYLFQLGSSSFEVWHGPFFFQITLKYAPS